LAPGDWGSWTLGLALVLFTDAVSINLREVRQRSTLAWVVLGPGTLLPAVLIGTAAYALLSLPLAAAAMIGAALASTDPVLLRSVLRSSHLPATPRVALRLESGMNDAVLLPVIVLAALALPATSREDAHIVSHLFGLFLLGPLLGGLIGWVGITMLVQVRSRVGVRRDYESLYALGLGFASFAAAETVGGSGFLAAFAAGLAIASLDVELCDCFLEYGEATAEMLLLLTFVAFGATLIWTGLTVVDVRTFVFAMIALVARTAVLYPVLKAIGVGQQDRKLIALFGPRGLSSLLLMLLPVFWGITGADRWFTITCLVVLLSLLLHGSIMGLFLRRGAQRHSRVSLPMAGEAMGNERISLGEVTGLQASGSPVAMLDARAERSYEADPRTIVGSIRIPPDDALRAVRAQHLDSNATLVVYCA
jgi:NhaP-type Na+/H+ or K+/H+ antiporter